MSLLRFSGDIAKGARGRMEELDTKRRENIDALRRFVADNPYASDEEIAQYAESLEGSHRYLQAPGTGEGSVRALGRTTARNRQQRDVSDRMANAQSWQQYMEMNPQANASELAEMRTQLFGSDPSLWPANSNEGAIQGLVERRNRQQEIERFNEESQLYDTKRRIEKAEEDRLYEAWMGGRPIEGVMEARRLGIDQNSGFMGEALSEFYGNADASAMEQRFANRVMSDPHISGMLERSLQSGSVTTYDQFRQHAGLPDSPLIRSWFDTKAKQESERQAALGREQFLQRFRMMDTIDQRLTQIGAEGLVTGSDEYNQNPIIQMAKQMGMSDEAISDTMARGHYLTASRNRQTALQEATERAMENADTAQGQFMSTMQAMGEDLDPNVRAALSQIGSQYVVTPEGYDAVYDVIGARGIKNKTAGQIAREIVARSPTGFQSRETYISSQANNIAATQSGTTMEPMSSTAFQTFVAGDPQTGQPGVAQRAAQTVRQQVDRITSNIDQMEAGWDTATYATREGQIDTALSDIEAQIDQLKMLRIQSVRDGNFVNTYSQNSGMERVNRIQAVDRATTQAEASLREMQQELQLAKERLYEMTHDEEARDAYAADQQDRADARRQRQRQANARNYDNARGGLGGGN